MNKLVLTVSHLHKETICNYRMKAYLRMLFNTTNSYTDNKSNYRLYNQPIGFDFRFLLLSFVLQNQKRDSVSCLSHSLFKLCRTASLAAAHCLIKGNLIRIQSDKHNKLREVRENTWFERERTHLRLIRSTSREAIRLYICDQHYSKTYSVSWWGRQTQRLSLQMHISLSMCSRAHFTRKRKESCLKFFTSAPFSRITSFLPHNDISHQWLIDSKHDVRQKRVPINL